MILTKTYKRNAVPTVQSVVCFLNYRLYSRTTKESRMG